MVGKYHWSFNIISSQNCLTSSTALQKFTYLNVILELGPDNFVTEQTGVNLIYFTVFILR